MRMSAEPVEMRESLPKLVAAAEVILIRVEPTEPVEPLGAETVALPVIPDPFVIPSFVRSSAVPMTCIDAPFAVSSLEPIKKFKLFAEPSPTAAPKALFATPATQRSRFAPTPL